MADTAAVGAAPLLLAIESAGAIASVALLRGEALLGERSSEPGQHHSERLLPMIDELLTQLDVGLPAIDAFAISIGPGSFTSLRIGLATLKGLAFGSDRPVVPVCTLEALALVAQTRYPERTEAGGLLIPALNAQRGEVYAGLYRASPDGPERLMEDGVHRPHELSSRLSKDRPEARAGMLVVGDGARVFNEIGPELAASDSIQIEAAPFSRPEASAVGLLGQWGLGRGEGAPAAELVPRYVRRAEAEVLRTAQRFE